MMCIVMNIFMSAQCTKFYFLTQILLGLKYDTTSFYSEFHKYVSCYNLLFKKDRLLQLFLISPLQVKNTKPQSYMLYPDLHGLIVSICLPLNFVNNIWIKSQMESNIKSKTPRDKKRKHQ